MVVAVGVLGGTITLTARRKGAGVEPTLDADALMAAVPGLAAISDIWLENFRTGRRVISSRGRPCGGHQA